MPKAAAKIFEFYVEQMLLTRELAPGHSERR
jgi:hypothetical protein